MTRYRTKASGWIEDEIYSDAESLCPSMEVDGPVEIDTGLVTATGEAIYRVPPPVGFGRDDEW